MLRIETLDNEPLSGLGNVILNFSCSLKGRSWTTTTSLWLACVEIRQENHASVKNIEILRIL